MAAGSELDGLGAVEWYHLAHAYGVATDIPDQLRAMVGADPAAAEWALRELGTRLHRDQAAFSAAPATAPFLIAIASRPEVPARIRAGALLLLGDVADARAGDPAVARDLLRTLNTFRSPLGALLDSGPPAVAVAAAALAARLVPPPAEWARRFRDREAAELDGVAAAVYAVAAALGEGRPPDRKTIERAAAASVEVRLWRDRELSGLLGVRITPAAAGRLAGVLARSAVARLLAQENK